MRRPATVVLGAIAVAGLAGCVRKALPPGSYQLRGSAQNYTLQPPVATPPASLVLKKARSGRGRRDAQCGVNLVDISLGWKGRTATLRLSRNITHPTGPVLLEGPLRVTGETSTDLQWWTDFRRELDMRESQGCLAPREAAALSGRIIENLALPTTMLYRLRYGNYAYSGHFDLESRFVLKSVSPLLKAGVAAFRTAEDVRGYETVYYDLKPRSGGGLAVSLRSVHHNVGGVLSSPRRPEGERFQSPKFGRYMRLFFRTWSVGTDRRIAILAVSRLTQMDELTRRFEAAPESFCAGVPSNEATCVTVPRDMVIGPELRIATNGVDRFVPVGGSMGDLLRESRTEPTPDLLAKIQVLRPYNGQLAPVEFDRTKGDILRLIFIGGEVVRW